MNVKKLIGPLIVTLILILYFAVIGLGIIGIPEISGLKIFGIIIPLICIGFSIWALVDRIKEIRSGEEDDLSKY